MSTSLSRIAVRVEINGRQYDQEVEHRQTLADFLRENLSLTGTHVGCEQGVCGSRLPDAGSAGRQYEDHYR